MAAQKKTVAVVGDVTIDWMVMNPGGAPSMIEYPDIWGSYLCRAAAQPGGAAMLAALLEALVAGDPALAKTYRVTGPAVPSRALASPAYDGLNLTWTSWALHPRSLAEKKAFAWRMVSFWGQSGPEGAGDLGQVYPADGSAPAILAVDDSRLGFRDAEQVWSRLVEAQEPPRAVVLKMTAPLTTGPLWQRLSASHADALTVVVPVNDLRKGSVQVGNPLSWERTAQEIDVAVRSTGLIKAARVVVNLGPAGVMLVERDGGFTLVFDPRAQEGDWEKQHPGLVLGYATCVSAALVLDALRGGDDPSLLLDQSIQAMRALHSEGYDVVDAGGAPMSVDDAKDARRVHGLRFPYGAVAAAFAGDRPAAFAQLHLPEAPKTGSSILVQSLGERDLAAVACQAAVAGPESLPSGIPVEAVGKWSSVDRSEIEGMRAVRNIMAGYIADFLRGARLERPLSIAVFGPPGAGKSFAVKQIAKVLLPGRLETVTFNLSQSRSEDELPQAFHQVRDMVLKQALPLVFWDEFDTPLAGERLGWLRYFLAPMQDGEFREAGAFHPVGPAIFVFAGGTCSTLQQFAETRDEEAEKAAKKPDFLSRLKGYVNVFGPNPVGPDDVAFMLRRALLLRGMLTGKAPQLFQRGKLQIDDGLLRAFIGIDRYRNGARSMEAIIDTSALGGRLLYERSSLPPEGQLALQVDARAFLDLMERA